MLKRIMALMLAVCLMAVFFPAADCVISAPAYAEETPVEDPPAADPTKEPEKKKKKKLKVTIKSKQRSVFAGEEDIKITVTVKKGTAPYTLVFKVNGEKQETVTLTEAGSKTFTWSPKKGGDIKFKAVVTDAAGKKVTASVTVPVAEQAREYVPTWKKTMEDVILTGDWREDLLNIAMTQLGYEESEVDFIVDENGVKQGYTRYGEWYGSSYADWCGMFISFCLEHAGISAAQFPREANPSKWKKQLSWLSAYEDDEDVYVPQRGDLIFFNYKKENAPVHMAIVEMVTENTIYTLEGNSEKEVRICEYPKDDERIVGYGNTTALMERAEVEIPDKTVELPFVPEEGVTALTREDGIYIRADATTRSIILVPVPNAGETVFVKYATATQDEIWYAVDYNGVSGYIRGDLLFLQIKN